MSQPDEQTWITDYFNAADTSMDGQLEFEEVWRLLQRMSVKMTRKQARLKFNVSSCTLVFNIFLFNGYEISFSSLQTLELFFSLQFSL